MRGVCGDAAHLLRQAQDADTAQVRGLHQYLPPGADLHSHTVGAQYKYAACQDALSGEV